MLSPRVVSAVGPRPARIAIVGEAPGADEVSSGRPFVGASGEALDGMLSAVGIRREDCFITNVFDRRPDGNNLAAFGVVKEQASPSSLALGPFQTNPSSLYVSEDNLVSVARLRAELDEARPNVIVALGNTACWAILGEPAVSRQRGTVHTAWPLATDDNPRPKVVPTFHPAAVLRQWTLRPIACGDLAKANAESAFPERRHAEALLWVEPTLSDLDAFDLHMGKSPLLSVDVETRNGMITEVGFAPSPSIAINIPFRLRGPDPSYWPTLREEQAAWRWVRKWCESAIPKVFQNGMYDLQYLDRHGIRVRNFHHDTMLAHHALFAELPKDLGFLGSVYTNHPSWKYLAARSRAGDDLKKDA